MSDIITPKNPLNILTGLCDFCGTCVAVCPENCIDLGETTIAIDFSLCSLCLNCVKVCPLHVISAVERGVNAVRG